MKRKWIACVVSARGISAPTTASVPRNSRLPVPQGPTRSRAQRKDSAILRPRLAIEQKEGT
jgi:hypothetical protein